MSVPASRCAFTQRCKQLICKHFQEASAASSGAVVSSSLSFSFSPSSLSFLCFLLM